MYLNRNQSQYDDWYCVVIFPNRTLEPSDIRTHRVFLNSDQVQRIYLDELGTPNMPIGINFQVNEPQIDLTSIPLSYEERGFDFLPNASREGAGD